jgi:hypothetical protein
MANSSRRSSVSQFAGVALALAFATGSVSCAPSHLPPPEMPSAASPTFVAMLTPGVSIQGDDGKWQVAGEDPVSPPPFQSDWPADLTRGATPKLLELSAHFTATGARHCWVKVPGRDKALYGVLALLPVFSTSSNPSAKRTYRMDIPGANVDQARGGQISVVYEPYPYAYKAIEKDAKGKEYVADASGEMPSWILWISDVPFAGGMNSAPPPVDVPAPPAPPAAPTPPPAGKKK